MYLGNYRLQKTCSGKCLKSCFSEDSSRSNIVNNANPVEIWATEPLTCLVITLKVIETATVCLSDMQNLRTVS